MDEVLSKYAKAYEDLHGEPPIIERRGSWFSIGKGASWMTVKCRKSDIPAMTNQLIFRLKKRQDTPK